MIEDGRFFRETVIDIDAAVVGISRRRWISIPHAEATSDRAAQSMKDNLFDILPIESPGDIKEYYQTCGWNDYSSVVRKTVKHRDLISFTTPLRSVIQGFALESRNFYFLGNERRIVGLISIADLNCRQVKVYLFNLLSELEMQLAKLVSAHVSDDDLLGMTFANEKSMYAEVKKRYESDKAKGVHVPFVQYLYFSDLINVIRKKNLFDQLEYESGGKFQDAFGPLVCLRQKVAHPPRSLITEPKSCNELWNQIDQIEKTLFHLR